MKDFTLNKHKVLGLIMLIAVWTLAYLAIGNSVVLPSPIETALALKEIVLSQNFVTTILTTVSRIMMSFFIGLILALVLGIISALNQWFYDLLSPTISLFKIVPTVLI